MMVEASSCGCGANTYISDNVIVVTWLFALLEIVVNLAL